jgi:hypothetical protein
MGVSNPRIQIATVSFGGASKPLIPLVFARKKNHFTLFELLFLCSFYQKVFNKRCADPAFREVEHSERPQVAGVLQCEMVAGLEGSASFDGLVVDENSAQFERIRSETARFIESDGPQKTVDSHGLSGRESTA